MYKCHLTCFCSQSLELVAWRRSVWEANKGMFDRGLFSFAQQGRVDKSYATGRGEKNWKLSIRWMCN